MKASFTGRRGFLLAVATSICLAAVGASSAGATTYKQVETGGLTTCAVTTSNTVKCWGLNGSGELGNGTYDASTTPVDVVAGPGLGPLTGVKSVTIGTSTCALMVAGTVKCWGWNGFNYGSLGIDDGVISDSPYPLTVVSAPGSTSPLQNVAELDAQCARLTNGKVKCWGYNGAGELGDGTTTDRFAPVYVRTSNLNPSPLTNVKSIGARSTHACAALESGLVKCWGDNVWHQVSDSNDIRITAPVFIRTGSSLLALLTNADKVQIGPNHSCALSNSGGVKCWGLNSNGALARGFGGDNTNVGPFPYAAPVVTAHGSSTPVSGITALAPICVIRSNTTAGCWGENGIGQLGDGTTTATDFPSTVVTSETDSSPLQNVIDIDAGDALHGCAIVSDHSLHCWGYNEFGQVGDGTTTTHLAPVLIN